MNRLKSHALLLLFAALILSTTSMAYAGSVKGGNVTVYNSGRALVSEFRSVTLPKGLASVVFKDVAATLDPTSVRAFAKGMTVLDLEYSYLPITTKNLLDRYLGKELTIIMPDPTEEDSRMLRKATLISNEDAPVFMVGNEVYVGSYEAFLLPELPKGLHVEPTLTLTTDNDSAAKRDVRLSYLMGGLTWRADYALALNAKGDSATLDAWATISNSSGRGFSGTTFKLVAGEVQRAGGRPRMMYAKNAVMMDAEMASAPPMPAEEQFSQYHVYSIPRAVTLSESGTKQLGLFNSHKIAVKQQLTSRFHGGGGQRTGAMKQSVELSLSFVNTSKNGLGRPMPAGLVRVFMPTSDGSQLLAGESNVGHKGEGAKVDLTLGRSFDVKVERRQTTFKKLGKRSVEMGWRIEILNGKNSAQALKLNDMYSGEWDVTKADSDYVKKDAGTLEFDLSVPPTKDGTPVVLNYTVRVNY